MKLILLLFQWKFFLLPFCLMPICLAITTGDDCAQEEKEQVFLPLNELNHEIAQIAQIAQRNSFSILDQDHLERMVNEVMQILENRFHRKLSDKPTIKIGPSSEGSLGEYDPEENTVILYRETLLEIQRNLRLSSSQLEGVIKSLLAHELTHAFQFQNADLMAKRNEIKKRQLENLPENGRNVLVEMIPTFLLEGHATLVQELITEEMGVGPLFRMGVALVSKNVKSEARDKRSMMIKMNYFLARNYFKLQLMDKFGDEVFDGNLKDSSQQKKFEQELYSTLWDLLSASYDELKNEKDDQTMLRKLESMPAFEI